VTTYNRGNSYRCDNNALIGAGGDVTYTSSQTLGSLSRVDTPNYHKRLEAGELLPLNAYNRWDYHNDRPVASLSASCCTFGNWYVVGAYRHNSEGRVLCPDDPGFVDPTDWSGIDTDALIIAAMADVLPDLDALTTAVEAHKTFNMVKNARSDAKDLIVSALRGGKHTVKAASDAWMAWRYGWQQLGYDCKNIADFVKKPIQGLQVTGQSGQSTSWVDESSSVVPNVGEEAYQHYDDRIEWDISYRARVVAQYELNTLNYVADVPLTLWESIPYSFVADWFVNIGDVLAAWKLKRITKGIVGSLGTKLTANRIHTWRQVAWKCSSVNMTAPFSERLEAKTRVPAGIPELVPSLNVELNSQRITDLAAMLSKRIL
jgi:hypothetical protein